MPLAYPVSGAETFVGIQRALQAAHYVPRNGYAR